MKERLFYLIMINEQENIDFSIVTIINDQKMFEGFCTSLNKQKGVRVQLIPIYNLNNEFYSARKAYNSILDKCTGKYVIFTHPDIRMETPNTLSSIKQNLCELDSFGVVGAAGAVADNNNIENRIIYSSIHHGKDKREAGEIIKKPMVVQTVDECFFIVDRKFIISNKFDEVDGWHLYAVELCLECILKKKNNYVVPMTLWHISDGKSLDASYVYQIERIIKMYGKQFPIIYTTVKAWKTSGILPKIYRSYYALKQKIKTSIRK